MTAHKKIIIIILFVVLVVIAGLYSMYQFFNYKYDISHKISLYFKSAIVRKGTIKSQMIFPGSIDFIQHANLQFQQIPTTGAKIAFIGPKVGDYANKNQLIAKLDTTEAERNLTADQATYRSNKSALDLVIDNIHQFQYGNGGFPNVGSPNETQTQKTQRQQAEETINVSYDSIQKDLKVLQESALNAPFAGLIVREDINTAGINITDPSTAQFEILDPKTFFFNVNMDETEVANFHEGDKGVVLLTAYPSDYLIGTVSYLAFTTHKDSDNNDVYTVRITLDNLNNDNYKFRFGMTGNFIYNTIAENILYIPKDFLHSDDNGSYVNVGKERRKTYITTGINDGTNIEVKSGLSEDTRIYY